MTTFKHIDSHVLWTPYLIADAQQSVVRMLADKLTAAMHEAELDLTVGPRYGPPAPRVEIEEERCPHCGHVIDEWDY